MAVKDRLALLVKAVGEVEPGTFVCNGGGAVLPPPAAPFATETAPTGNQPVPVEGADDGVSFDVGYCARLEVIDRRDDLQLSRLDETGQHLA